MAAWDWLAGCASVWRLAGAGWLGSGAGEGFPAVAHALSCAWSQPPVLGPACPLPAPHPGQHLPSLHQRHGSMSRGRGVAGGC